MNKRILASLLLVSGHCIAAESGQLSLAGGSNLSGDAVGLQVVTSDADASVELINQVRGNPVALETLRQEFYKERKAKKRNNRWYKKIGRKLFSSKQKERASAHDKDRAAQEDGADDVFLPSSRKYSSDQGSLNTLIGSIEGEPQVQERQHSTTPILITRSVCDGVPEVREHTDSEGRRSYALVTTDLSNDLKMECATKSLSKNKESEG